VHCRKTIQYYKSFIFLLCLISLNIPRMPQKCVITADAENVSPPPSLFSKNNCPHNTFSRHYTVNTDLMNAEDFQAVASMWVLSTPYSTVLTINVFAQVELCFVCNNKLYVQTINPLFGKKNHGVDCRIAA